MAPTNSFLLLLSLAVLSGVTSALYASPYPNKNNTDTNNTPVQLEWTPRLTTIAVLSALLCLSNTACCLLTGALLFLCRERRELLREREREREQKRTHTSNNQHTAAAPQQLQSLKSPHIYCNIESLSAAARPYPQFSSPVSYEELDIGMISCESNYTVFTDLTLTA